MKSGLKMKRDSVQNSVSQFSNITNRINYLAHKNQAVNKKLLSYMNCFERRLLSERSQDSTSIDKNCLTFRINNHSKKVKLKSEVGKQKSLINANSIERRTHFENQNKTESQIKHQDLKSLNHPKSVKQKNQHQLKLRQEPFNSKDLQNGNISLQNLKRGRHLLNQTRNLTTKDCFYPYQKPQQSIVKTNNFFITPSISHKKSPYTKILSTLKGRKDKQHSQEKLKMIEIKKKLLEEEEKSLVEYQQCVLYKQKIVQKIKHQQLGSIICGAEMKKNHIEQSQVHISAIYDDQ